MSGALLKGTAECLLVLFPLLPVQALLHRECKKLIADQNQVLILCIYKEAFYYILMNTELHYFMFFVSAWSLD